MRWAWLLVVVACAPARPEKLERPKRIAHASAPATHETVAPSRVKLVPRPDLDLGLPIPEFHDELRWPLTPLNHPSLEPRFPIAQMFAQPGVGWLDLCGLGVQNRFGGDQQLLSYLRGWCSAINGDIDEACRDLVPLFHAGTPGLEAAVRTDLANILANEGHADKAEHYINIHDIWDVGMLDVLAANYVEVGTTDDAVTINRHAIDSDDHASAATKCMRWTKQIVLLDDKHSPLLKQVEIYATQPKIPDGTCVREYHKLDCWAADMCTPFYLDLGVTQPQIDLLYVHRRWDTAPWTNTAVMALEAGLVATPLLRFTGFAMFARYDPSEIWFASLGIAALENAIAYEGRCNPYTYLLVDAYRRHVHAFVDAEWRGRLDALVAKCR